MHAKIHFIEDQLQNLDHYLPETYEYLMGELDQQRRQLAEIEIYERFHQIEVDHQDQTSAKPHSKSLRAQRALNSKHH